MDNFIVVWGPARSGTSLMCELVEACGYNFGNAHNYPGSRRGLREHYISSQPTNSPELRDRNISIIKKEGITACKVIGFHDMLQPIRNMGFNVKIVSITRDDTDRLISATENYYHDHSMNFNIDVMDNNKIKISKEQKNLSDKDKTARDKFLSSGDWKYLNITFETLLDKDVTYLKKLCKFLEIDPTDDLINTLSDIIDPSISLYTRK